MIPIGSWARPPRPLVQHGRVSNGTECISFIRPATCMGLMAAKAVQVGPEPWACLCVQALYSVS